MEIKVLVLHVADQGSIPSITGGPSAPPAMTPEHKAGVALERY